MISVALIEKNKKKYGIADLKTIISDYEKLDFKEEFDCAVFYDCLHHTEDKYEALNSVYKALKRGGMIITAEPGVGHAMAPASQRAMSEYGVTEKDMPPKNIIVISKSIGFRKYQVYYRKTEPILLSPKLCIPTLKTLLQFTRMFLKRSMQSSKFVVLTK